MKQTTGWFASICVIIVLTAVIGLIINLDFNDLLGIVCGFLLFIGMCMFTLLAISITKDSHDGTPIEAKNLRLGSYSGSIVFQNGEDFIIYMDASTWNGAGNMDGDKRRFVKIPKIAASVTEANYFALKVSVHSGIKTYELFAPSPIFQSLEI